MPSTRTPGEKMASCSGSGRLRRLTCCHPAPLHAEAQRAALVAVTAWVRYAAVPAAAADAIDCWRVRERSRTGEEVRLVARVVQCG
jgi:hypothetical protein